MKHPQILQKFITLVSFVALALVARLRIDADAFVAARAPVLALVDVRAHVGGRVEAVAGVAQVVALNRFKVGVCYVQTVVGAFEKKTRKI